jgi:cytochrome c biogenesis factor
MGTQVSPEHVATWYLQDLRIIQVMLRAFFCCTIILFSLGCPATASNLIKYEHNFHHSQNRWMSIYIYLITVQQNKYIIHIFELYI